MVLLDLGCTWCLISLQIMEELGLRLRTLKQPIGFSQLDGSLTGGAPVTCLMKPVSLRVGTRVETTHFIVAPGMTETSLVEEMEPISKLGEQQVANKKKSG